MKIHSLLKSSIKEILQIVSHKQDKYLKTKDKSVISIQKYYKASRIMKFSDKIFFDEDNSLIKNKECS